MTDVLEHTNLDDGFGYWLAGFIDGEGCFLIPRASARADQQTNSYACRFELTLRADDEAVLLDIYARTRIGRVSGSRHRNRENPAARWAIGSKADCAALVRLLDRYPLRAKKAVDYAIWRRAVGAWQRMRSGNRTQPQAWAEIAALSVALRELRAYGVVPTEVADPPQLRIAGDG